MKEVLQAFHGIQNSHRFHGIHRLPRVHVFNGFHGFHGLLSHPHLLDPSIESVEHMYPHSLCKQLATWNPLDTMASMEAADESG